MEIQVYFKEKVKNTILLFFSIFHVLGNLTFITFGEFFPFSFLIFFNRFFFLLFPHPFFK